MPLCLYVKLTVTTFELMKDVRAAEGLSSIKVGPEGRKFADSG